MSPALPSSLRQAHTGMRYGLLGFALAFVALPLYVHLPHVYASRYHMSLTTLGGVLLLARVLDAWMDPAIGRLGDRWYARSPRHALAVAAVAAVVLALSMALLFFPPWNPTDNTVAVLATLMLTYVSFSTVTITHQAWAARLANTDTQRAQVVAWREGFGLLGVMAASLLPSWLGWDAWLGVFGLAMLAGWYAWQTCPAPVAGMPNATPDGPADMLVPWRSNAFRQLMLVFVLSGLASAIPATLVIFFIQDLLQAPDQEALFLGIYFFAAAAAMPVWMRGIARWGLARCWLAGMVLSVGVFIWTTQLAGGDVIAFTWICALSGVALATDLSIPSAMLASVIAERGEIGRHEGAYFGWWTMASKFNLALAAGLTLPLLSWLGYQPASHSPQGLQALTWAYAVLPCALKLMAAFTLYLAFVRATSLHFSPQSEA